MNYVQILFEKAAQEKKRPTYPLHDLLEGHDLLSGDPDVVSVGDVLRISGATTHLLSELIVVAVPATRSRWWLSQGSHSR